MSNEKVFVQLGNKVLQIDADNVDRYIAKGFDVVSKGGDVIQQSIPNEYGALRVLYEQKLDEIEALKHEIETLKRKPAEPKKSAKSIADTLVEAIEEAPKTVPTKRTSRSKSK